MNMGMCMASGSNFMCKCQPGFTGHKCEICDPCTPNPVNIIYLNNKFEKVNFLIQVYEHGAMYGKWKWIYVPMPSRFYWPKM